MNERFWISLHLFKRNIHTLRSLALTVSANSPLPPDRQIGAGARDRAARSRVRDDRVRRLLADHVDRRDDEEAGGAGARRPGRGWGCCASPPPPGGSVLSTTAFESAGSPILQLHDAWWPQALSAIHFRTAASSGALSRPGITSRPIAEFASFIPRTSCTPFTTASRSSFASSLLSSK